MGNLRKHAKLCWGEEAITATDNTKDIRIAREALEKMPVSSSITSAFKPVYKEKVTVNIPPLRPGEYSLTLPFHSYLIGIPV
jgi:hypothetical protein